MSAASDRRWLAITSSLLPFLPGNKSFVSTCAHLQNASIRSSLQPGLLTARHQHKRK